MVTCFLGEWKSGLFGEWPSGLFGVGCLLGKLSGLVFFLGDWCSGLEHSLGDGMSGRLESDESESLDFFCHQYLIIGIHRMCNLDNECLILGLL